MDNPDPLENRPSAIKTLSRRGFRNKGDDVATLPPASTTSGTQTRRTGHPEKSTMTKPTPTLPRRCLDNQSPHGPSRSSFSFQKRELIV